MVSNWQLRCKRYFLFEKLKHLTCFVYVSGKNALAA